MPPQSGLVGDAMGPGRGFNGVVLAWVPWVGSTQVPRGLYLPTADQASHCVLHEGYANLR